MIKNRKCFYCEKPFYKGDTNQLAIRKTKDHIIPVSRGGINGTKNIVWACVNCNGLKSNLSLEEFRQVVMVSVTKDFKYKKKYETILNNIDNLIIQIAPYRHELYRFQDADPPFVLPKPDPVKYEPPPVFKGISKEGNDWYKNYYLQNVLIPQRNFHEQPTQP